MDTIDDKELLLGFREEGLVPRSAVAARVGALLGAMLGVFAAGMLARRLWAPDLLENAGDDWMLVVITFGDFLLRGVLMVTVGGVCGYLFALLIQTNFYFGTALGWDAERFKQGNRGGLIVRMSNRLLLAIVGIGVGILVSAQGLRGVSIALLLQQSNPSEYAVGFLWSRILAIVLVSVVVAVIAWRVSLSLFITVQRERLRGLRNIEFG